MLPIGRKTMLLVSLFIMGAFIVLIVVPIILFPCWQQRSNFGQTYGFVSAFFSAFSLIFVVFALFAQQKQLANHERQLEKQNLLQTMQSFESQFFNMVNLHNTLLESVSYLDKKTDRRDAKGRDAIEKALSEMNHELSAGLAGLTSDDAIMECISKVHALVCLSSRVFLGHYFRNIYHIIKFVDESPIDPTEKPRHIAIFRAQFSDAELQMLFLNGLTGLGHKEFKPLIEKYCFLKRTPSSQFVRRLKYLYDSKAFGE